MSRGTIQNPTQSQDFHFVQVLFIQNHSFLFELIRVLSSAWMSFHTTRKQSDWFISNAFKFQNQELFTSNYLKFQPKIGMKMADMTSWGHCIQIRYFENSWGHLRCAIFLSKDVYSFKRYLWFVIFWVFASKIRFLIELKNSWWAPGASKI